MELTEQISGKHARVLNKIIHKSKSSQMKIIKKKKQEQQHKIKSNTCLHQATYCASCSDCRPNVRFRCGGAYIVYLLKFRTNERTKDERKVRQMTDLLNKYTDQPIE